MDIRPILNQVAPTNILGEDTQLKTAMAGETQVEGQEGLSHEFSKLLENLNANLNEMKGKGGAPLSAKISPKGQAPEEVKKFEEMDLQELSEELTQEADVLDLAQPSTEVPKEFEGKKIIKVGAHAPKQEMGLNSEKIEIKSVKNLPPELKKLVDQKREKQGQEKVSSPVQENRTQQSIENILQANRLAERSSMFLSKEQLKVRGDQNIQQFKGQGVTPKANEVILPLSKEMTATPKAQEKPFISPYTMKTLVRQEVHSPQMPLHVNKAQGLNQYMANRPQSRIIQMKPEISLQTPQVANQAEAPVFKMNQFELQSQQPVHQPFSSAQTQITQALLMTAANPETIGLTNDQVLDEVTTKINQYIESSRLTGKDQLNLKVHQENLGQFDINVKNNINGQVEIMVKASDDKVAEFFKDNQGKLMNSLMNNGVKVSEFKLEHQSTRQDQNSFTHKGYHSSQSQSHGDSHSGSEKRRQMWEYYQERMSA